MPDASGRFRGISVPGIPWHGEETTTTRVRPPLEINGDDCRWIIASSEEQARDYYRGDHVLLVDDGWALNVGWNHLDYSTRRDFREETGLTSWWEIGVPAPADEVETAKRRRAFRVEYVPAEPAARQQPGSTPTDTTRE